VKQVKLDKNEILKKLEEFTDTDIITENISKPPKKISDGMKKKTIKNIVAQSSMG
jgi:hypothetical protein